MTSGISTVELLVTTAIMVLLLSIVLVNSPHARERTILNNTAQEMALALRDAQARAIAVSYDPGGSGFPGYGIYFAASTPDKYILFTDRDGNKVRTNASEDVSEYKIKSGVGISALQKAGLGTKDALHILYLRPYPSITVYDDVLADLGEGRYEICLKTASQGLKKSIDVWTTGQVSISNGAGCP